MLDLYSVVVVVHVIVTMGFGGTVPEDMSRATEKVATQPLSTVGAETSDTVTPGSGFVTVKVKSLIACVPGAI